MDDKPKISDNQQDETEAMSLYVRSVYLGLIHVLTLAVYVIPMFVTVPVEYSGVQAVLDELHIVADANKDVNSPSATLRDIVRDDYWGRPLDSPSSHKSWRPVSILSFRYLRGTDWRFKSGVAVSDLTMHRFVNIVTHAATAELVGILAVKLIGNGSASSSFLLWLRILAKLSFALHPTHIEATANAANRPHLLAILCSVVACDPSIRFPLFILVTVFGFLACETFLFQIPPIAVTMLVITCLKYHPSCKQSKVGSRSSSSNNYDNNHNTLWSILWQGVYQIRPRLFWLFMSSVAYYGGRHYFDTLSIPTGLIRPAENPFYDLAGWTRVYSYALVLSVHILKQWDLDYVGFSHEYGFNCIEAIEHDHDPRLWIPVGIVTLHVIVGWYIFWTKQRKCSTWTRPFLLYIVYLSWSVTLFPVSGIVKVGTFIADRIVVASTVPVAVLQAYLATCWITMSDTNRQRRYILLLLVGLVMYRRIYERSQQWLDPKALLESSLQTCPNFAKAHVEISKIYSGLYPQIFNLTKSRYHLHRVEEIDPGFCDVHHQFALVAFQEHKYPEFEERLLQSLLCQFTAGSAMPMWQKYWEIQLNEQQNTPAAVQENRRRYRSYQNVINEAIAKDAAEEQRRQKQQSAKKKSPFAINWNP